MCLQHQDQGACGTRNLFLWVYRKTRELFRDNQGDIVTLDKASFLEGVASDILGGGFRYVQCSPQKLGKYDPIGRYDMFQRG